MQTKREKAIAIALKNNIKSHINKKQDTAIKYYNVGDNYVKLNDNLHETDPRLSKHDKMMGSKRTTEALLDKNLVTQKGEITPTTTVCNWCNGSGVERVFAGNFEHDYRQNCVHCKGLGLIKWKNIKSRHREN